MELQSELLVLQLKKEHLANLLFQYLPREDKRNCNRFVINFQAVNSGNQVVSESWRNDQQRGIFAMGKAIFPQEYWICISREKWRGTGKKDPLLGRFDNFQIRP